MHVVTTTTTTTTDEYIRVLLLDYGVSGGFNNFTLKLSLNIMAFAFQINPLNYNIVYM